MVRGGFFISLCVVDLKGGDGIAGLSQGLGIGGVCDSVATNYGVVLGDYLGTQSDCGFNVGAQLTGVGGDGCVGPRGDFLLKLLGK